MTSLAKYTFCIHKYSKGHQSQVSSDLLSILDFPNELPYELLIFYLSSHREWEHSGGDDIESATTILRKVYSVFSTVFLLLLLLAVAVGFPAACFGR